MVPRMAKVATPMLYKCDCCICSYQPLTILIDFAPATCPPKSEYPYFNDRRGGDRACRGGEMEKVEIESFVVVVATVVLLLLPALL